MVCISAVGHAPEVKLPTEVRKIIQHWKIASNSPSQSPTLPITTSVNNVTFQIPLPSPQRYQSPPALTTVTFHYHSIIPYHTWSQSPEVFYEKGAFKYFTKFTEKHLCQSLFFNPFSTNVPLLYPPPENIRKPPVFWSFQGV